MNILLGITGSVAAILHKKIYTELKNLGKVKVVVTERSKTFIKDMEYIPQEDLYSDSEEWMWKKDDGSIRFHYEKNDPIRHIELRQWADVFVIAPLTANTLAKIANGICDNLLTSIARAWDYSKPFIVAPSMNSVMWENNLTQKHLSELQYKMRKTQRTKYNDSKQIDTDFYTDRYTCFSYVETQEKILACGESGNGAMADIKDIINRIILFTTWSFPLKRSECNGIPDHSHPGGFGYKRRFSHHTGVDLYTTEGALVHACENGTVVSVEPFTGKQDNSPHWLDTDAVLIKGLSGVICYGEIKPYVKVGGYVYEGQVIGAVKQVVKDGNERPDIPGHSKCMLHLELYTHDRLKTSTSWKLGEKKHDYLLDPTDYLFKSVEIGNKYERPFNLEFSDIVDILSFEGKNIYGHDS